MEPNDKQKEEAQSVAETDLRIEEAARAVYRKYGANLSAFWRDAFAAEARKHGRTDVEQHAVGGNCIHCVPICGKCQIAGVEAHVRTLSSRDTEIREVLEGLRDDDCFDACFLRWMKRYRDSDGFEHTDACLAAQALWNKLQE